MSCVRYLRHEEPLYIVRVSSARGGNKKSANLADSLLRCYAVDVSREHRAFFDVGDAEEAGGDALEADGEAAVRRHAVAEGVEVEMESIRIHATTEHLLAIVGCSVLRSVLSRSVPPARRRRAQPTPRMAHTAPHSATPPPMRHTRGGKRRLFLPGQKRYGLSQKRNIGLSIFITFLGGAVTDFLPIQWKDAPGLSFFRATAGRARV